MTTRPLPLPPRRPSDADELERAERGRRGGELERGELGGTSEATRARRIYYCEPRRGVRANLAMPPHPRDDGAARPKWNSKWEFDRAGERVQIVVVAIGSDGDEETIDAREFIERLGDNHEGTTFAIHVETEQIGNPQPIEHEKKANR